MSTQISNHDLTSANTLCAIYLRISLDSTGEGLGVARQKPACEAIAKAKGWGVYETYTDNSISASKENVRRPGYERMRVDFEAGKFAAIVVWDLDRLTRQPIQLEYWIRSAERSGLKIATASGESDLTNGDSIMLARIMLSVRKNEVDKKSIRQKFANAQRADRGLLFGGTRPTGYTSQGEVIEAEATTIRHIFDAFEAGWSVKGITEALRLDHVPTRTGKSWSRSTVHDILTNHKYAGRQTINRVPTGKPGNWAAIVSEEQFDLVQVKFEDPARTRLRKGTDRRYLGSGLFLCGVCQREVQVYGNGPTYGCPRHLYKSQASVDAIVLKQVSQRLARPDVLSLLSPRDDERLRALATKSANLRRRVATIEADYDRGEIDGKRYAVASSRVRDDLAEVEKQRATLMAGNTVGVLLTSPDPAARFLEAPIPVQQAVVKALMEVTLRPNKGSRRKFDRFTVDARWHSMSLEGDLYFADVTEQAVAALA